MHGKGAPENSLAAAEAAIAAGMGIECDIQRSSDDVAMVFHDWDVERLTGEQGQTGSMPAAFLSELQYQASREKPASLAQLLRLIAGRVPLLIEIKSKPGYDVERSCEIVSYAVAAYSGDVAIMSFDPRVAAWVRANSPQTCCGLVMREDEHGYTQTAAERWEAFEHAQPDFLAYHIAALPNDWVAGLRENGLPILSWTVNSPNTRARALAHVDALVSEGAGLP
uniref:glycerophosphodiester phosphodiesterase family protein n=1 Tax=uncultured Erythrobacter sp. TaxID=263913 RepID=UPI0026308CFA|nr:glycerophosphodiester phosphodiesterase family protein [uncultured Erythrobacter sp.]